jgi:hypothetical protein
MPFYYEQHCNKAMYFHDVHTFPPNGSKFPCVWHQLDCFQYTYHLVNWLYSGMTYSALLWLYDDKDNLHALIWLNVMLFHMRCSYLLLLIPCTCSSRMRTFHFKWHFVTEFTNLTWGVTVCNNLF